MKIGIEIHVQLPTKSKLFCSCPSKAEEPNTSICPICLGHPGSKPSINKKAVELAIKVAKALNCSISKITHFSRKTYFYPDLAKNYQITQYEIPIGLNGWFICNNKKIRIKRVHLEEDPAKIMKISNGYSDFTQLDYNRSGIPLIEIVTEPDFESPEMVKLFLKLLLVTLNYLDISTNKDESILKTDLNISIGESKVEIKNVTGFKNAEKALSYEYKRQKKLVMHGIKIKQKTMHFDEKRGVTYESREKETEEDYGYIFEPDLPLFNLNNLDILIPELPSQKVEKIVSRFCLDKEKVTEIVFNSKELTELFEDVADRCNNPALLLNWLKGPIKALIQKYTTTKIKSNLSEFINIMNMLSSKKISDNTAKQLLEELISTGRTKDYDKLKKDEKMLRKIVSNFIEQNPGLVQQYKQDKKVINFIIGKIIKETNKQFEPREILSVVEKILSEY